MDVNEGLKFLEKFKKKKTGRESGCRVGGSGKIQKTFFFFFFFLGLGGGGVRGGVGGGGQG